MKDDDDGGINLFGFLGRIFGEIVKTKLKEVKIVIFPDHKNERTRECDFSDKRKTKFC